MPEAPETAIFNAGIYLRVASAQKLIELLSFLRDDWDEANSASFRAMLVQFLDRQYPTESIAVAPMPVPVRTALLELGFMILDEVRRLPNDELRSMLHEFDKEHLFNDIRAVAPSAN